VSPPSDSSPEGYDAGVDEDFDGDDGEEEMLSLDGEWLSLGQGRRMRRNLKCDSD
jgi:hypothetical protein